jgi:hypothetical protein
VAMVDIVYCDVYLFCGLDGKEEIELNKFRVIDIIAYFCYNYYINKSFIKNLNHEENCCIISINRFGV